MKKILLLGVAALAFIACNSNAPVQPTVKVQLQPEGGVFNLSNGVSIVVPQGAVSSATEVTVEYMDNLDESVGDLPSDIQGRLRLTPEGLTFAKPIEVSMPLNQPAQASPDILYWSDKDGMWYITDRGRVEGDKVKFYIEHFSDYTSVSGGWGDLFARMDAAVGGAQSESAVSAALNDFLANTMWKDMGLEDFTWSTRAEMGGSAVSTCAHCCGLFASWMSQDGTSERQGSARYKEQSTHNIITNIALSNAQMSAHLRSEYQMAADRIIEIYGEPCATVLKGAASPDNIEKGKTTQVTVNALCDGSPLSGQLIQLSYSPELSSNIVNQKTDDNGQITITVKGEEEGTGYVYAKAVNALNSDLVTEIQIPVTVGNGENWRITIDVTEQVTTSWAEANDGGGAYTDNYRYEGGDQSIAYGYTIVYDISIKDMSQQAGMAGVGEVTGKCAVTNHPDRFKMNVSAFSQSGQMTNEAWGIVINCSSSQSAFTAAPEYHNLSDVPLYGSCYPQDGKRYMAIFGGMSSADDIGGYDTSLRLIYQYAFLIPHVRGTWSWVEDERSDNGSYYFGNVPLDQTDNYNELALLSLYGLIEIDDLKEVDTPFQFAEDNLNMHEIEIGGSKFGLNTLHNVVGTYTDWYPGHWEGKRHRTATGTLKIENLSKAK